MSTEFETQLLAFLEYSLGICSELWSKHDNILFLREYDSDYGGNFYRGKLEEIFNVN